MTDINHLEEFCKNISKYDSDEIKQFLHKLIREKTEFKNLGGEKNFKVLWDTINSQREKLRNGIGISEQNISNKMHELYGKRIELGLTEEDLKDIRTILHYFKK